MNDSVKGVGALSLVGVATGGGVGFDDPMVETLCD